LGIFVFEFFRTSPQATGHSFLSFADFFRAPAGQHQPWYSFSTFSGFTHADTMDDGAHGLYFKWS